VLSFHCDRNLSVVRLFLLLVTAMLLRPSVLRAVEAEPSKGVSIQEVADIVYSRPDGQPLRLDLFKPNGAREPLPVIVYVHGGAWRGGRRQRFRGAAADAASRGYVGVTISYRLAPKHPWPAQIQDVQAAIRWLRENADTYSVDPRRIGVAGASAGGHLALLLGLLPDGQRAEDTRVQAVVNYFGFSDVSRKIFGDSAERTIEEFLGASLEENPALWAEASPASHVSAADPPVLSFHGSADSVVHPAQAQILHRLLDVHDVPNQLEILDGLGHGWMGEDLRRTRDIGFRFLDAYLKGESIDGSQLPLLLREDFDEGSIRWSPTDVSAWKLGALQGDLFFSLVKRKSNYEPEVRSPYNISLLENITVSDFVFDVRLQSTVADYGHRDLCLFFGYQDPSHFYYVHLGKKADPHAHSIFLVNGAPRVSIATFRTIGVDWDDRWHRTRIRRDTESGKIEVFFDDMMDPILWTKDKTFLHGRVGIGSFDDTGNFDEIRLWGKKGVRG